MSEKEELMIAFAKYECFFTPDVFLALQSELDMLFLVE
jgi:hypothetical protein